METGKPPAPDQREALEDAEKKASVPQRESYDERGADDKVVEIPPVKPGDTSIGGLDNDPARDDTK